MNFLFPIYFFFWVLLLENTFGDNAVLFEIVDGLEVRISLIIKMSIFILNIISIVGLGKVKIELKFFGVFLLFLFLSTCYTLLLNRSFFFNGLSQFIHILLNFQILFFVYINTKNERNIIGLMNGLSVFAYFNAILVIISYFYPNLLTSFEAGTSYSGTTRAFGLMGDEVSLFLTFFLYYDLIRKRIFGVLIFLSAILCTGGIGATFTSAILMCYYFYSKIKEYKFSQIKKNLFLFSSGLLVVIFISQLPKLSVFTRIGQNLYEFEEGGSGQFRLLSILNGYEMFVNRPIFGVGYGAYKNNVMSNYTGLIENNGNVMSESTAGNILGSTYNPFLQMLCESGIIGLIFFIYLIMNTYSLLKIKIQTSSIFVQNIRKTSLGWLVIFILTCLTANWFLPNSFLMLLIMTLVGLNLKINELSNKLCEY
jgi:hypothetical protein